MFCLCRLTESDGRKVSFREAMIIMTSNAGADCIQGGGRQVGFEFSGEESNKSSSNVVKSRVMEELKVHRCLLRCKLNMTKPDL